MKEEILKILIENFGELATGITCLLLAGLKKKWDLRTLRKKGLLKVEEKGQE